MFSLCSVEECASQHEPPANPKLWSTCGYLRACPSLLQEHASHQKPPAKLSSQQPLPNTPTCCPVLSGLLGGGSAGSGCVCGCTGSCCTGGGARPGPSAAAAHWNRSREGGEAQSRAAAMVPAALAAARLRSEEDEDE